MEHNFRSDIPRINTEPHNYAAQYNYSEASVVEGCTCLYNKYHADHDINSGVA